MSMHLVLALADVWVLFGSTEALERGVWFSLATRRSQHVVEPGCRSRALIGFHQRLPSSDSPVL